MNRVLSPIQREDLRKLLNFIYLDLEEFKPGEFKFRQHSSLDSKFSHPSAVSYVSQCTIRLYKLPGVALSYVSDLVDVLLKADELWWCATRIVDSRRGTLSVDNPFKNCKSIPCIFPCAFTSAFCQPYVTKHTIVESAIGTRHKKIPRLAK